MVARVCQLLARIIPVATAPRRPPFELRAYHRTRCAVVNPLRKLAHRLSSGIMWSTWTAGTDR
jgi:hypothetical protein